MRTRSYRRVPSALCRTYSPQVALSRFRVVELRRGPAAVVRSEQAVALPTWLTRNVQGPLEYLRSDIGTVTIASVSQCSRNERTGTDAQSHSRARTSDPSYSCDPECEWVSFVRPRTPNWMAVKPCRLTSRIWTCLPDARFVSVSKSERIVLPWRHSWECPRRIRIGELQLSSLGSL